MINWEASWFQTPFRDPWLGLSQLLNFTTLLLPVFSGSGSASITCLTDPSSTTLDSLIKCFDKYTVPKNYYNLTTYHAAQPDPTEQSAWATAIASLLDVDDNCTSTPLPDALKGIYTIDLFTESTPCKSSFCVLSESTANASVYTRGWGLVVVPATRAAVSREIHFSAPHPKFDTNTPMQAAALFKGTGAKSLLISGRRRDAFLNKTECIPSTSTMYYKTDPAHDNNEPFFLASDETRRWRHAKGGCPTTSCAFLEMHGKGQWTCPSDNVFMSSGLGKGSWYTNNVDRPIKRLQTQLNLTFPTWKNSLPTDSSCDLTATKNIFGRLLNGIDEPDICTKAANTTSATGQLVHIEQDLRARREENYFGWVNAVKLAFEAKCMEGMSVDPITLLCI